MRKWIALLLAAVMCLAFAACGGAETVAEEPPQTEEPAAPEEVAVPEETVSLPEEEPTDDTASEEPASAESAEDAVCCVITVSINPEFELQLNKNGAVLALTCLNEDAQAALENTDVTGMPVDEAITVLLEDIYRYDSTVFPEDQPQIKVTVAMYEEFTPIYQAIDRMDAAVMSFADSHQLLLAYMRGKAPTSEEIRTVVSESVDDNGNRVLFQILCHAVGTVGEFHQFTGHALGQSGNLGDAVTDQNDNAGFADFHFVFVVFDLTTNDFCYFFGS